MSEQLNSTSTAILDDAINALSLSALEQIQSHCQSSIDLAKTYANTFQQNLSLVKDDRFDMLRMLEAYCNKIINQKRKANNG